MSLLRVFFDTWYLRLVCLVGLLVLLPEAALGKEDAALFGIVLAVLLTRTWHPGRRELERGFWDE